MTEPLDLDELLPRLRDRAADPDRRTSSRPSELGAQMRSLDLGGLLSMGRSLADQLRGVVAANQAGTIDPAGTAAALDLERRMTTPAAVRAPGARRCGDDRGGGGPHRGALPPALRRVYAEVADGGFGPGEGLLPISLVVRQLDELRSPGMMPEGRTWPTGLLPLVSMDPGWDCVEAATGRVIAWDPEDLDERVSDRTWAAAFREIQPSRRGVADRLGGLPDAGRGPRDRDALHARERCLHPHPERSRRCRPSSSPGSGCGPGWEAEMAERMGVPWPPPGEAATD